LVHGKESKTKGNRHQPIREIYRGYVDGRETEIEGKEGVKETGKR